jgi:hypothetical protein
VIAVLPFSTNQFLEVFAIYNNAIYPAQWVLICVALAVIISSVAKKLKKMVVIFLAFLWLWAGIVYHVIFFSRINGAAFLFGFLFISQSLILFYFGLIKGSVRFHPRLNTRGILGGFWVVYALVLYPLFNDVLGHRYPSSPTFGAPCPVTIFTFGLLFWTDRRAPLFVIAVPFFWTAVGAAAAFLLGMYEDIGLPAAAITYCVFWVTDKR